MCRVLLDWTRCIHGSESSKKNKTGTHKHSRRGYWGCIRARSPGSGQSCTGGTSGRICRAARTKELSPTKRRASSVFRAVISCGLPVGAHVHSTLEQVVETSLVTVCQNAVQLIRAAGCRIGSLLRSDCRTLVSGALTESRQNLVIVGPMERLPRGTDDWVFESSGGVAPARIRGSLVSQRCKVKRECAWTPLTSICDGKTACITRRQ